MLCQDQTLKLGLVSGFPETLVGLVFSSSFGFALRVLSDSFSRDRGTAAMLCLSSGESKSIFPADCSQ